MLAARGRASRISVIALDKSNAASGALNILLESNRSFDFLKKFVVGNQLRKTISLTNKRVNPSVEKIILGSVITLSQLVPVCNSAL
jgi:hypothetical protein